MSDARMKRISRELFLSALGVNFAAIDFWVTDRLTALLEEEEVGAREYIFKAGEPPDYFYFVRHGRVDLLGNGKLAEVIEGPRAFGMLDALAERPRSHSAYAPLPLHLLKIRLSEWNDLLEDSFELASMLVRGLVRSVSALEERVWERGHYPPPIVLDASGTPLDVVERVVLLMHNPLLLGAGVQPLTDLATGCEEVTFAEGASLFARGGAPDRVFVLISGRVSASRAAPHVSWVGGPGQLVCGVAPFDAGIASWEARADIETRALSFRADDWFDVMEENFEMVRATLAALSTEHQRLLGQL